MRRFKVALIAGAALSLTGLPAFAEPTALVEDITTDRNDVQLMDYLEPGMVIELAPDETLTVGYLLSCVQETITGGRVTIGEDESVVSGGAVETEQVDCDGGPIVAAVGGAEVEAGAAAFRAGSAKELPLPDRIIFGLSPIVKLSADAPSLTLSRLDEEETEQSIPASGRIIDFEKIGLVLAHGGTYTLTAGEKGMVFKVSRLAEKSGVPPVARLLPL
ncbi:MAG: hypothetical protein RIM72_09405 [Alphaproteobacteria bacterium]